MNIKIILSTTRPGKASDKVGNWALSELIRIDPQNEYEIIDLSKIDLPYFDETDSPRNNNYKNAHTKEWSKIISESDGFVIVLAEYNGGYPAPIKNAIDYLYWEWVDKPVGFIGYGSSGANGAIRQLSEILTKMKMKVLDIKVQVSKVWNAFDSDGNIDSSLVSGSFWDFVKEMKEHLI